MVNAPFLSLDRLSVAVSGVDAPQRMILREASLTIAAGEVVAIVGPSGGGKSTLLKSILGLTRFTDGTLHYRGAPTRRPLDAVHRRLRASAEAVLQNPLGALNPYATLRYAIEEPLRARGASRADRGRRAETIAERMGLTTEVLDRKPRSVALGQAQRACIARALAPRPELLVLDEPLSALDALVAAEVAALLADVIAEASPTVLFVSHDMRLVRRLATRIVVIEHGRIVEDEPANQVLSAPRSNAARALVTCDKRRRAAFAEAGATISAEAVA